MIAVDDEFSPLTADVFEGNGLNPIVDRLLWRGEKSCHKLPAVVTIRGLYDACYILRITSDAPHLLCHLRGVFMAEIVGDKLLYTTGLLATRYKTLPILCGMAVAFMLKMAVAVASVN
ncbi:MAG: hypothetical protein WDO73_18820 [Ignavibacteriota bacterium]